MVCIVIVRIVVIYTIRKDQLPKNQGVIISTCPRRDLIFVSGSWYQPADNKFMNIIRTIPALDSSLGYSVTDIDASIWNHLTGKGITLEIKEHKAIPPYSQTEHLNWLSQSLCSNSLWQGVYLIQHQGVGPEDSKDTKIYCLLDKQWKPIWNVTGEGSSLLFSKDELYEFIKKKTWT